MIAAVRIQEEDFDAGSEIDGLVRRCGELGALATFTGYVRSDEGLSALMIEHYPAMCEREIARHIGEAERRWTLRAVSVVHRVGRLTPASRIVFVAAAAMHRRDAFEACEFLMDYLKTRAPFWKQEERNGAASWVEAKNADDQAAARWRR
jgi:molybdopterin synthase catalytic subunit